MKKPTIFNKIWVFYQLHKKGVIATICLIVIAIVASSLVWVGRDSLFGHPKMDKESAEQYDTIVDTNVADYYKHTCTVMENIKITQFQFFQAAATKELDKKNYQKKLNTYADTLTNAAQIIGKDAPNNVLYPDREIDFRPEAKRFNQSLTNVAETLSKTTLDESNKKLSDATRTFYESIPLPTSATRKQVEKIGACQRTIFMSRTKNNGSVLRIYRDADKIITSINKSYEPLEKLTQQQNVNEEEMRSQVDTIIKEIISTSRKQQKTLTALKKHSSYFPPENIVGVSHPTISVADMMNMRLTRLIKEWEKCRKILPTTSGETFGDTLIETAVFSRMELTNMMSEILWRIPATNDEAKILGQEKNIFMPNNEKQDD